MDLVENPKVYGCETCVPVHRSGPRGTALIAGQAHAASIRETPQEAGFALALNLSDYMGTG